MNNPKHTPGPWAVSAENPRKVIAVRSLNGLDPLTGENLIGGASVHPDAEANARLIAAAPELLKVLKEIADIRTATTADDAHLLGACISHARAAIAKATGEAPHVD